MSKSLSTTSRRKNGEGTISQDPTRGDYVGKIRVNGKRHTRRGKDEHAVRLKLKRISVDSAHGQVISSNKLTLRQYLAEWIAGAWQDAERRPGTLRGYAVNIRHVSEHPISSLRLGAVTPRHVQALLRDLRAKGLSERTVQYVRATLRVALGDAVELEEIARNPAQVARRTGRKRGAQGSRKRVQPLDPTQARHVLEIARGERLEALFVMAIAVGLRRGELLGLRWADVDFARRQINVRWQIAESQDERGPRRLDFAWVKTDGSERTVDMPDVLVEALLAHRDRQTFESQAALNLWLGQDLVFCTVFGTIIETTALYRIWKRLRTAAGVKCRLHDLRHTAASLMLAHGCELWQVSKILGHSSYQFTVDTYGHLYAETRRAAADLMNAALLANG